MFDIKHPYLMFLGDAADQLAAKTAVGVAQWRPEWCVGQFRLENCRADLGLRDMTPEEAAEAGVRSVIVGVANRGGIVSPAWTEALVRFMERGMDVAAGLHQKLAEAPALAEAAAKHGRKLFDVRHPTETFAIGTGKKRSGKRLLAVGTDCSVGKMYVTLAMEREIRARGLNCDFRATGQTGIFIAGSGVSVDAIVADFISGAVEALAPSSADDHWDLIEGQGSLFHASFAGVSMGLLHGAQPDALILCHEPNRPHMRGLEHYRLPSLEDTMEANLAAARLTNPDAAFVGVSLNTEALDDSEAERVVKQTEDRLGLPCADPVRTGVAAIADRLH